MLLLTLARVYGGEKISGQSLYCFNPHRSFRSCGKLTNIKQNKIYKKMHPSSEEVKGVLVVLESFVVLKYEFCGITVCFMVLKFVVVV